MTYQPCHHSGGRLPSDRARQLAVAASRARMGHPTSCSERMLEFYRRELAPRNVMLTLVVADLYKVWLKGWAVGGSGRRRGRGGERKVSGSGLRSAQYQAGAGGGGFVQGEGAKGTRKEGCRESGGGRRGGCRPWVEWRGGGRRDLQELCRFSSSCTYDVRVRPPLRPRPPPRPHASPSPRL